MVVLKNGIASPNEWVRVPDDGQIPEDLKIIVSLERLRIEQEKLQRRKEAVGVSLKSDQSPSLIKEDLNYLSLISLDFPKFTDGRAFSYAHILRNRYSYRGEIRAFGQVLRDQYLFMLRCGFDTIEPLATKSIDGYAEALKEFSVFYQPMSDTRQTIIQLRHREVQFAAA